MIVTEADMVTLRTRHRGQRLVFAIGTYDLLHAGHLLHLAWAKKQGDVLVVAVNDDLKVRNHKGWERPIMPESHRLALVDSLRFVDYVVLGKWRGGDYDTAFWRLGTKLKPDIVCIDTAPHHDIAAWRTALPESIVVTDLQQKAYSTTDIINLIIAKHS
ncbi:MAG TPA: adenylyltransferase/cytidyltransferase family protein [Candidatus Saccharimonadales bacterium]|nr:adenylyltransferase/cytidyltransferase family protein [Candidatus Saccharimonadales bacterium]